MRISNPEKVELEPKSLQIVKQGGAADPTIQAVSYDNGDYSTSPFADRVQGIWEVLAYQDVPRAALPPYGFFNDIWILAHGNLTIVRRGPGSKENRESLEYLVDGDSIVPQQTSGLSPLRASFNKWGHLIVDSGKGAMVLKLVSKSTKEIPHISPKVVLLRSSAK